MMIPCLLNLSPAFQIIFYLSAFFAFGVKIPLFPMHIWLPEAHGEAPTYGSILLAGILLKLGGYGFYKFFSPGFSVFSPESETNFFPLVYTISVITIIYSTIMVFSQIDIKKTIAYYSVGHMGFVTLGFGSGFLEGEMGAVFIMLAHGLSSSGLFFLIGYIYEQLHTRSIYAYRGLSSVIPYFSLYLFIFLCANASVPGTINFIGEQLVLFSLAKLDITLLFLPALGLVLNGLSTFLFIIKLIFGEINYSSATLRDLNSPSFYFSLALSVPLILFGFMPNFLLAAVY
jgi:NADH:ubiquinone oxidoreductase subunit 4 (subunit M)